MLICLLRLQTMVHANTLQHDLQGAINELRTTRGKVIELSDENQRLHDETKQVSIESSSQKICEKFNLTSELLRNKFVTG